MRVLIYAPAARMGGARAHVLGLLPELASIAPDDEVLLVAQPDLIGELPPLPRTWVVRAERAETRGFFGRLLWEQRALPRLAEAWRADVLLSFGAYVPLRSPCPSVVEAGNALYFTRAFWHVLRREPLRLRLEERARWSLLRASLRAAERVLTPTRAMRTDVVTRLPGLGPRVDVALWGVAPIFHAVRWWPPAGDAILGVSKHGINKEFDVLIAALPFIRRRWPGARLVLTGTADESRWSRRSVALADRLGVLDRVCFTGDVPNSGVPDLMRQARVLVFPTWCESFGLPLAEALAMGAPAVAADIPACREVGGDAARYYATGDADSLADCIGDVLGSPEAADDLACRARERGRMFRWRDNAVGVRQTLLRAAA
ncbi:MAG: glycosyltransferase [Chloroflexi bacterium]|nr:glycosyltransferase [Chloroflexota bacterium]MBV9598203.1 glycosyltransferase [Chloroflexota bacterium]